MSEYYEITFEGSISSKKNQYGQTKSGRRFKPQSIVDTEVLCLSQIPAEMWDLKLIHPGVETWMYWPKKSWGQDQDGAWTTCCDYLVKSQVIKNDDLRNFNGEKFHHPAVESDRKKLVIRLYPNGKIPRA